VHVHPTGKQAFVVTAAPPGERNDRRGQLLVVDLATGKVGKSVPLGLNPLDSAMTPDGARLFTADWGSRALSVVDLTTGRLQDSLPLGQYAARTLAMRADGKTAYAVLERAVVATTMNSAPSTYQNMAQTNIAPAEEATLLAEIAVASHKLTRHPLPGLSPVCALTPSPDGRLLYIYGRRTPAGSVGRQPAGDGYVLLCYDLKTHAVVRSLGDFGFLTRIVVSPNGEKLYLIGTPGDPAREAIVQQNYVKRSQGTPNMAGPAGPSGSAPANTPSASARQSPQITETLEDLRRLEKTVTILDAHSGRRLKTLTVGSLPQGAAVRK
jgi:DNA-binding beta-propeller fold protein YncE